MLFHLVTLPVEFDASRRAMGQLDELGITADGTIHAGARNVLSAAAMTYVAGPWRRSSQLAYFVFAFLGHATSRPVAASNARTQIQCLAPICVGGTVPRGVWPDPCGARVSRDLRARVRACR